MIGNGPSSAKWIAHRHSPTIGCNKAVFDFKMDHCVIVDRFAIAEIIDDLPQGIDYWTKKSPLELPTNFQEMTAPGIDSGSFAIALAAKLYKNHQIVCVGFDGVLGADKSNRYTYRFRNFQTHAQPNTHTKHRTTVVELAQRHNVKFVHTQPDPDLEIIDYDTAISLVRT